MLRWLYVVLHLLFEAFASRLHIAPRLLFHQSDRELLVVAREQ